MDSGISTVRGVVFEGIVKKAIRGVSRSCCGGEGIKGRGLEWLNYLWTLAQFHKIQNPLSLVLWILKS